MMKAKIKCKIGDIDFELEFEYECNSDLSSIVDKIIGECKEKPRLTFPAPSKNPFEPPLTTNPWFPNDQIRY